MSTSSERPSAANVLDFTSSPPSSFPRSHATETTSRSGDRSTGRTCVVVLGMHRSGTSALTRVISLLGASLPKNMMPPAAQNNALGFWEPAGLVALHDELLSEAGSSWDDWRRLDLDGRLPAARLAHYKIAIAGELSEAYDESPLFVLKDPRICRFFPLYREILNDMGIAVRIVVPLRDPAAVTASLRARDGIPEAVGQLYWLRHMLDAEADTRGVQRAFVAYESLLADWRRAIAPLTSGLGVDWPRGADHGPRRSGQPLGHLLRKVGHPHTRRYRAPAAIRLLLAADQPQERALAGAVAAQQPDPLAGLDLPGDAVEEWRAVVGDRDVVEVHEGHGGCTRGWWMCGGRRSGILTVRGKSPASDVRKPPNAGRVRGDGRRGPAWAAWYDRRRSSPPAASRPHR